jgi:predicted RNA-binding Zn-ribbon protein involved in translation (DUF1610 family)
MNSYEDVTDIPNRLLKCPKCGSMNITEYVNVSYHISEEQCNDCGWKANRYF